MRKNKPVITRLSQYKNALSHFQRLGFVKIFSEYLAEAVGVTSTQVRKDFSLFGIQGNKRGGYQINALLDKLNDILGKNELQKVILVGAGNLGSALLKYKNFQKEGIKLLAAFDIDPAKQNTREPVPVLLFDQMEKFVTDNGIKIGILAVPEIAAQMTLDKMTSAGIRGVLNFSPIQLKPADGCIVNNVNLELELENLIYFVNAMEKTGVNYSEKEEPQNIE